MASSKPTILFIPGAWNTGESYEKVIPLLEKHGYKCRALTLPSAGGEEQITHIVDAEYIQRMLTDLVDQGEDVIIAMHSYGGIPGTESAKGFSKAEREKEGKKGGVVGLVYIAAFLLPVGASLHSFLGEDHFPPDWLQVESFRGTVVRATDAFYNDLSAADADAYTSKLRHHVISTFKSPLGYAAYQSIPTTYLLCERDKAIPIQGQRAMVKFCSNGISTHTCNSGHFPMYSAPETVADVIRRSAGEAIEVVSVVSVVL